MNPLYQQFGFNQSDFLGQLNKLKAKGGDPNQMIQEMLNFCTENQKTY